MNRLLWIMALVVALLPLTAMTAVHAATYATIQDGAKLFTSAGRASIEQTAEQANLHVIVNTTRQNFATPAAWYRYLQGQTNDSSAVIIGLNVPHHRVHVIAGSASGVSQATVQQSINDATSYIGNGQAAEGVIQMIKDYRPSASYSGTSYMKSLATTPAPSSGGGGFPWGWVIVLIIVVGIIALLVRMFRYRMGGYGGPMGGGQYGPTGGPFNAGGYGPGYGPGYGGGGFGRGLLGGILGGVGGAWLGNQLFGRQDVDASGMNGPDWAQQNTPLDTPDAQNMGGDWSGDAGAWNDPGSGADSGSWGGGGDSGSWGGDSGGGSGDGSW